ncbi:MAG TPA: hypothetical protein VHT28_09915 [Silvibacterium sp.]|nr:hypothetical protein [Silvibacterium sp.]
MKPTLFLRIASILTLIFCVGHTVGGVLSPPAPGVQAFVVQTMKANPFDAFGGMRTFWDFHLGYGLIISVVLLSHSILFWLLGNLVRQDGTRLRPIFLLLSLEFLAQAPIAFRYFFLGPGIISLVIAACLAAAFFTARPVAAS